MNPGKSVRGLGRIRFFVSLSSLSLALVVLLAAPAMAATWYVDAAAAPGGDGASWATALAAIQDGLDQARSGDVVEVAGGLYLETLVPPRAGVTVAGSAAYGRDGPVTVRAGNGRSVLTVSRHTVWKRLVFDGSLNTDQSVAVVRITAGAPAFEQCVFGPGQQLLDVGTGGATFARSTFRQARRGNWVYGQVLDIDAVDAPVTFDYCLFGDMEYGYVQVQSASRVEFNNCLLAGFSGDMLFIPASGNVAGGIHLTNCLTMASGFAATALVENRSTAAPVTLTNCLIQDKSPVEITGTKFIGDVTEVAPLVPGSPKLARGRRPALINFGLDDAENVGYWTEFAALAESFGIKTTLAMDVDNATPADWAAVQSWVDRGHEVAAHSAHHVYLPEKRLMTLAYGGPGSGAAVTVTSVGTAGATLAVSAIDDPSANFSLDLSAPATDTIEGVCAAINAKAGFSCGVIAISGTTYTSARVLSRGLAAVAGVSIQPVTATLSRDDAQFFADEIAAPKAVIEAQLRAPGGGPYDCTSFVYPFLDTDASVIAATAAAGYTAARTGYDGSYAMGGFYSGVTPGGYDTLAIWAERPGDIFGRFLDPATLARRVSAFLEWAKFTGAAVSLYGHGSDEYTLEEWSALFALVVADGQVRTATLAGIRQYVAANAESQAGSTFVRTVWPDLADYHPLRGSPLVRAGAAYATAKTDMSGALVPAGTIPNLGLYQGLGEAPTAFPAIDLLLLRP